MADREKRNVCWWGCSIGHRDSHHGAQPVPGVGRAENKQAAWGEHAPDVVEKRRRVEGVLDDVEGRDDVELPGVGREQRVHIATA